MIERDQVTAQIWDQLHTERRFRPQYPHEEVVRWALGSFPEDRRAGLAVLDLGCGGGRHAVFLAREGFRTWAVDHSSVGIEETRKWAAAEELDVELAVADAVRLPYEDEKFDAVLCYGVLCYLPYDVVIRAVGEIHRVLKPGGQAFVMTRTDKDDRSKGATRLGGATYRLKKDMPTDRTVSAEAGMIHSFLDADQVRKAFRAFSSVTIDHRVVTYDDGTFTNDDWLIRATR